MSDRGIIFSAPMVLALLAGRKTQTRRLIKGLGDEIDNSGDCESVYDLASGKTFRVPHRVGDRLYARETWACHWATDYQKARDIDPEAWTVRYFADDHLRPARKDGSCASLEQCTKKRPAIFMPRWASRLWLDVTEARIERLQDISEDDARAEGVIPEYAERCIDAGHPWTARPLFETLWGRLHDKPGERWDDNPFVSVTCFEVRQGNIDVEKAAA